MKNFFIVPAGSLQRIDLAILARLCRVLGCAVSDILEYLPPAE
ncbi:MULTISPECIES: helix-turn-helix domain-containing protein [Oscillospiraceae]